MTSKESFINQVLQGVEIVIDLYNKETDLPTIAEIDLSNHSNELRSISIEWSDEEGYTWRAYHKVNSQHHFTYGYKANSETGHILDPVCAWKRKNTFIKHLSAFLLEYL